MDKPVAKMRRGREVPRSPMMIDGSDSFDGLRAALKDTPKLRALVKQLVS